MRFELCDIPLFVEKYFSTSEGYAYDTFKRV